MLILASSSPQRRALLEMAGYEFSIIPPGVEAECGVCSQETPPEYVARLALQKAADVAERFSRGAAPMPSHVSDDAPRPVIIGCDTVAECMGHILGKPTDEKHARDMLELLSGREHHVYSGLCVWRWPAEPHVSVAVTKLKMDELSLAALEEYLASGQWEGKAGAFGYQDRVGWLTIVEGSESNVIGLPLELLAEMLAARAR